MKEKFKKIGIILLFVLFVLSGICLIASCSLKNKNNHDNKLSTASAPKLALYRDNSNGAYNSNNLLKKVGSVYTYSVKANTSNYVTTNFIELDTISAYTGNYFGGNKLSLDLTYYNLGTTNRDFYIYLSNTHYNNRSELPSSNYTRLQCYMYSNTQSDTTNISWQPNLAFLDLSKDIYVYITTTINSYSFNNTDLYFTHSYAYTYSNNDNLISRNSFDYFGVFVPRSYNEQTQQAIIDSYNTGYSQGVDAGYDNGYLRGYDDAMQISPEGNDFNNLITSVADTPFNILYNLLNFEILGVNLWVFITSLLSILIVMFIIKKIK